VSREFWLDLQSLQFNCKEDKGDVWSAAMRTGKPFAQDFAARRDELRKGGKSLTEAYRTAIAEFAPHVPTHEQLEKGGDYAKYQRMRRASERNKRKREGETEVFVTRQDMHERLKGKKSSIVRDVEWVDEHLFPGVDILALDLDDVPSRSALNLLEWATSNQTEYRRDYSKERIKSALTQNIALSDSGRDHEKLMAELLAAKAEIEGEEETTNAGV
jgi:hypothetical protein